MKKDDIDLRIKTKYDIPAKVTEIHPNLPVFPSYSIIVGAGNSGKSLMLVNLLHLTKKVFKNNFIVFSHSDCETMGVCCQKLGGVIYDDIYDNEGNDRILSLMEY